MKFFKRLFSHPKQEIHCAPPHLRDNDRIEKRHVSSIYYESDDFKEVQNLDASDKQRIDILTETSYALHDAHEDNDTKLELRICKEALANLDQISGKPGTPKISASIAELETYAKGLLSKAVSSP